MKTIEKQKVVKKKGKYIKANEPENEIVMRAEFDGKLIALMKVKPPKKED
ncbi:hypothetical protein J2Y45_003078 [Dyadobacter sp. BE34]|uniref:Uncharacterized protein n=1 Tax=Dyadobacter fermentans TaxID=94254 RepID=A0ABU1QTY7_9BACT|nr:MULTISPECIES: hypothetical protein [Dyadobacter]MDR6804614.1 hypothetical protein [Dyadobacter fermentans]MDR7043627.1 hypothetical protein [Dyadobacter sp. BE242]MDR7197939.1 hypothetical protein [Dyadobacter sp. BE34]MDR7214628.1 hypothetical protein [Dyadobacter sp. BE31]MDR7262163.1 hypothetical protein [Dyadobacter sp. BE32]